MKKQLLILLAMISIASCKPSQNLTTVGEVDIQKYAGQWFEIARLPNGFEKDLECVTADYSLKKNGKIEVLNQGYSIKDKSKVKKAKGTAWVPDSAFPGRLKVSFFWPFAGNYYIISLDKNYTYALVGDPTRKYLWVLARSSELDESIYSELLEIAGTHGFDTSAVIRVNQDCH